MAGLLDMFTDPNAAVDPRMMGLLGAFAGFGQSMQKGPASRLPYGQPSIIAPLGAAAGGFAGGMSQGTQMQLQQQQAKGLQTQDYGNQLQNLNAALMYNMWAPYMGNKPIQMPTMPGQAGPQAQAAPVPSPMAPTGDPMQGGTPSPMGAPAAPAGPMAAPATPMATPSAPGAATPSLNDLYKLPPPVLQHMGIKVPDELMNLFIAGVKPDSPAYQNAINSLVIKATGNKEFLGGDRPGSAIKRYNLATGGYDLVPGQLGPAGTMAQEAMTGVPAKETEAAFNAGLRVNTENEIEKRKTFYQTGQMPPNYGSTQMPVTSPTGDIGTERGTIVPKAPAPSFIGSDALAKQNTNTAETEKAFGSVRGGLEGTESRMVVLADALKKVQGKGLNEAKAQASSILRGAGMGPIADKVMSAESMSAVQTALGAQTLDILGQLKQINQGTGGKILNSEFTNLLDKQYGPDMSPEANYTLITQALAGIYQTRNLIDDYFKYGKPGGWRDANAFQSEYYGKKENSYSEMVKQAEKTVGPLKGMESKTGSYNPEDIAFTAQKYKMSEEDVLRHLTGGDR